MLMLTLLSGCSLILDFDDIENLPCGTGGSCDVDYVCRASSNRCVKRRSIDLYKSCPTDTPLGGDEFCPTENDRCIAVNDAGPRCLPKCVPVNYATPSASSELMSICPLGTTCWPVTGGGVCSEGVCNALTQDCPGTQMCGSFNGAGVCFTTCEIFQTNPLPCSAGQVCHPIGTESITACVDAGPRKRGEICDSQNMCEKTDETPQRRPMVCGKQMGTTQEQLRCWPICVPGDGSQCTELRESCLLARPNVDPLTQADLGICIQQ
jgi:hypothetical protein